MNFKSIFFAVFLAVAILCVGFSANVQANDMSGVIAQLQAQIASLMAQIKALQAQQQVVPQAWCHTFNNYLYFGKIISPGDANTLETALEKEGLISAPNSFSLDVPQFGEDIAAAVVKFQEKYGITATGTLGPKTRAKLNSLYGCGNIGNKVYGLTTDQILNSNGFVNGKKEDSLHQSGDSLSGIVLGQFDSDLSVEAVAIDTWCGASCGEGVVAFKLVNGNVLMVSLPDSAVSGAAQKIDPLKISDNGLIIVTESDFDGARTTNYRVKLLNGVLVAEKVNSQSACNPHWTCGWGNCVNGYQSQVPVDSNNCGMAYNYNGEIGLACPALARVCNSTGASVTVVSPNGGETWQKGTSQTITWNDSITTPNCPVGAYCVSPAPRFYDIKLAYYYAPCIGNVCTTPAMPAPLIIAKNVSGYSYSWEAGRVINDYNGASYVASDASYTIQVCKAGTDICDSSDSYFKIVSSLQNPSITGISGPTSLKVGEMGTWQVTVSQIGTNTPNSNLSYYVAWGDEPVTSTNRNYVGPNTASGADNAAKFSHTYNRAGSYSPTFTVINSSNLSAQASANVQITNSTTSGIILFYKQDCPYCTRVDNYINANGVLDKVGFTKLETFYNTDNLSLMTSKAAICGISTSSIGVPFLWDGSSCYMGYDNVVNFFSKYVSNPQPVSCSKVSGGTTSYINQYSSSYFKDTCYQWNPFPYTSNSNYTTVQSCSGSNCFLDQGFCNSDNTIGRNNAINASQGCLNGNLVY